MVFSYQYKIKEVCNNHLITYGWFHQVARYISRNFYFSIVLGMVIYAREFKTKEKQK